MDDIWKYGLAAILVLIGSHLLLYAWLKRRIAAMQEMQREIFAQQAAEIAEKVEAEKESKPDVASTP